MYEFPQTLREKLIELKLHTFIEGLEKLFSDDLEQAAIIAPLLEILN